MRETIGGTMLFWIVMFFMSIFIAFLASVIKYARVYKMKNSIINYIERQEGVSGPTELARELRNVGYPKDSYFDACIIRPREGAAYYSLTVNAVFSIPIAGFAYELPIKGETKIITSGATIMDTSNEFGRSECFYRCNTGTSKCLSESSLERLQG